MRARNRVYWEIIHVIHRIHEKSKSIIEIESDRQTNVCLGEMPEMLDLKPIETRWKGYRFRSRLEARWGVFFEALRLRWEYEPEGFLTDVGPYLPDFRVENWLVEIKPGPDGTIETAQGIGRAVSQLIGLAADGRRSMLLIGTPGNGTPHMAFEVYPTERGNGREGGELATSNFVFNGCRRCPGVVLEDREEGWVSTFGPCECSGDRWKGSLGEPNRRLLDAYAKARGARFEHGEKP